LVNIARHSQVSSMKTYFDCIPCLCQQALEAARLATDDVAIHEEVLRQALRAMGQMDLRLPPPRMGQLIHQWVRDLTGNQDPYADIKSRSNALTLGLLPDLRRKVEESADSLETAARLAIAGNIIDFGAHPQLEDGHVGQTIEQSLTAPLARDALAEFREAVVAADRILYLADNTGEIVLDRLLVEQLPMEKITLAVRGAPIINDATMVDAETAGLTDLVEVIDNGTDAPGTVLEHCSASFRRRFEEADLIISKGQGNYETLSDVPQNIFFLLKAKCPVIARYIGCELGSLVIRKTSALQPQQAASAT
jgi:uncharacterized protein with ATP-grasp and redox domains